MEAFLRSCNVIVATMQAVSGCSEDVRRKISECCSHIILDEAHHVKAPTWDAFRQLFHGKPILQFTATPFRNDGKHVGGRMAYSYPLRKAQEEGYFQRIRFRSVYSFTEPDRQIAQNAVEQLKEDRAANLDHIVMARVDSIQRAEEIHALYQEIAPEFSPLLIHSRLSKRVQRNALHHLRERTSRIIVCVDMLGEGFDLPQLKIAALHDIHKSLAITLQFTGRFTRVMGDTVGEATMIANRASVEVNKKLRALYAEDADWNQVIRELNQEAANAQEERSEFLRTFSLPREVPLQNVEPKMSTVVYRTDTNEWHPEGIYDLFPEDQLYTKQLSVSEQHHVVWFVTRETSDITWGEVRELENVVYNLYLLHWDEERGLLFINSSNNDSLHEDLAVAVVGEETERIHGSEVYRTMHGIQRMVPTNLGLLDLVSRTRRFMMLVGADVTEGFEPGQTHSKTKTNVFGCGYENGERVTIGCALKGRIWSYLVAADISQWVTWCHRIGTKLVDETINTDEVFRGFIKPVYVRKRPELVPLAVEWPLAFLEAQEDRITVQIGSMAAPFFETTLELVEHKREGPIRFKVTIEDQQALYQLSFGNEGTQYVPLGAEARITMGRRTKPLSEWFHQFAPKLHFEQDTYIEHDLLLRVERDIQPFDTARIEAWDWSGVDIRKESQGLEKAADSIQRRVIERVLSSDQHWDVVFDDDNAYEMADVVAIRMTVDRLIVHLYHCKFAAEGRLSARIDNFYEVCGQAQKSVHWRDRNGLANLIPHLLHRERLRREENKTSRFEVGDFAMLDEIAARREVLRPEFKVYVVQPGLPKSRATREVLELLAATSLYLHETYNIAFGVIVSE